MKELISKLEKVAVCNEHSKNKYSEIWRFKWGFVEIRIEKSTSFFCKESYEYSIYGCSLDHLKKSL